MVNEKFEAYKQLISDSDEAMVSAEKARLGGDVLAAKVLSTKAILLKETASQMFNPGAKNPKGSDAPVEAPPPPPLRGQIGQSLLRACRFFGDLAQGERSTDASSAPRCGFHLQSAAEQLEALRHAQKAEAPAAGGLLLSGNQVKAPPVVADR
jgi:hypothetical protein